MAAPPLLLNSQQRPATTAPTCLDELWDIMGLYGRQWEWTVNLWNDLEISSFRQFSVIMKMNLFNSLQYQLEVEFQRAAIFHKKLILKFLLLYPLCSFLKHGTEPPSKNTAGKTASGRLNCQMVCKPGSVRSRAANDMPGLAPRHHSRSLRLVDGHSSGTPVAGRLARPTRGSARKGA